MNLSVTKAVFHKKTGENQPPTSIQNELLVPVDNISAFKHLNGNQYEIFLKDGCYPKLGYEIGSVIATIKHAGNLQQL